MFKIPWGLLQMKQDELFQELQKSKPVENMGQVPAESYLLRWVLSNPSPPSQQHISQVGHEAVSSVACYASPFLYYKPFWPQFLSL